MKVDYQKLVVTDCAIPAALEAVGERWSFLILRGAFNGLEHFEEFQSTLGIARNILSNRLGRLVEHDILKREPDPADRRRIAYLLTDKGRALLPVLIALRQWGEKWVSGVPGNPVLVDREGRRPVATIAVRAADGRPLSLDELDWVRSSNKLGSRPRRARSIASNRILVVTPPGALKPPLRPSAARMRWQGMMIGIGLRPSARPTARAAPGSPIARASSP